jgi:hypothetical protein
LAAAIGATMFAVSLIGSLSVSSGSASAGSSGSGVPATGDNLWAAGLYDDGNNNLPLVEAH